MSSKSSGDFQKELMTKILKVSNEIEKHRRMPVADRMVLSPDQVDQGLQNGSIIFDNTGKIILNERKMAESKWPFPLELFIKKDKK